VLDHVERGRVLEQPARKNLAPGQLAFGIGPLLNEDLHEGTGLARALPRQGAFASGKADHDIADALGLARLDQHILGDVVPLVKQTECRHPVLDRRAIFTFNHRSRSLGSHGLGDFGCGSIGIAAAIAGGKQDQRAKGERAPHDQASGLHAS
jgi:hypothetical protein